MARRRKVQAQSKKSKQPKQLKQPKPEEPAFVSDQPTGAACELIDRWRWAFDEWDHSLYIEKAGAGKMLLVSVPRTPTREDPATAAVYPTDPPPTDEAQQRLRAEAGLQEFLRDAAKLADATTALLPLLRRHREETEAAVALIEALQTRADTPQLADQASAQTIRNQLLGIEGRIARGCLPPDEDLAERRAFWNQQLAGIRTAEGHAKLQDAVELILSAPRDPARELVLLNRFLGVSQEEDVLLVFEPVRRINGADPLSVCRRWQELVKFGTRFYSLNNVCFRDTITARALCPEAEVRYLELEWADLLRQATLDLRDPAARAGFSAGERIRITEMALSMEQVLQRETVDVSKAADAVRPLVDEIVAQAKQSRRAILDRVHQLVLDLKDGIAELLKLVRDRGGDAASCGLIALDQYITAPEPVGRQPGLGGHNDLEWRILTGLAATNLSEADQLWNQEIGDPPRPIRQDFTLVGGAPTAIGELRANSAHELVLMIARVLITPESRGSVPQDALEVVGPGPDEKPCPGVVRLRVVREMVKMPTKWPPQVTLALEKEHAAVLVAGSDGRHRGGAEGDPRLTPVVERPSAKRAADEVWQPSVHQQVVLAILKRDGPLLSGELWERVTPKYIDQRAHQNAMRELVARDRVRRTGKGRATTYSLP